MPLVICVGILAAFVGLIIWQPSYDVADPDYERLARQMQKLGEPDASLSPGARRQVDLGQLNEGQWTKVCLFGPFMSPVGMMIRERMLLSPSDYLRFAGLILHYPFRLSVVEEREAMLLYKDPWGISHVLHFQDGLPDHPHWSGCIQKPQTVMVL